MKKIVKNKKSFLLVVAALQIFTARALFWGKQQFKKELPVEQQRILTNFTLNAEQQEALNSFKKAFTRKPIPGAVGAAEKQLQDTREKQKKAQDQSIAAKIPQEYLDAVKAQLYLDWENKPISERALK